MVEGSSRTDGRIQKSRVKWLTILFGLFIVLVIILADIGQLSLFGFVNSIPYGDKAGHFILYGILTLLLDLTLMQALPDRSPRGVILSTGFILALLIGIEEYSQQFFAKRTFSLIDLLFSYLGVILFSLWALRTKNAKAPRRDAFAKPL